MLGFEKYSMALFTWLNMTLLDLSMTNKTRMNDQFQKRQKGEASEKSSACSSAGPSIEEPTERTERPTSRYQLIAQQFNVSWNKVSHIFPKAQVTSNKNTHNFHHHFWAQF